jgi:tetratricopeptide (TPR) repeat protein
MASAVTTAWGSSGTEVVGRAPEMARLDDGLTAALAGRSDLVLLTGDPGIGKTRLAREISDRAAAAGALPLWGRSWEAGGAPELWPWVQILRALAAVPDLRALLDVEPADRREQLARILPEIGAGGATLPLDPLEGESARFRLFEVVSRLLVRAAEIRPLVLVIYDLHAADPSSILLLRFVMREQRTARLLVVATIRLLEARRSPAVARLLDDLAREGETLRLGPLEEDDVARLVGLLTRVRPDADLVRDVYRLSEGNPLLAGEAVRLLSAGGGDRALRLEAVADRLPMLVRERLEGLSADCRAALTIAAVIGREFDLADLREASGIPSERLLDLLAEAETHGVLRGSRRAGLYGFVHGLLREASYADAPPSRRAELHRRVGEALERRYGFDAAGASNPGDAGAHLAELARHYGVDAAGASNPPGDAGAHLAELARHFGEAAQAGHDVAKALAYARRAGDQARHLYAYAEGAAHYAQALRLLGQADEHAEERTELLLALGLTQTQAGDGRQARATFLEAAALARRRGDVHGLGRAAVGIAGRGDMHIRFDREIVELIEEALARVGDGAEPALRARLLSKLARVLYYSGPRERVASAAAEGLAIARRVGSPSLLANALDAQHFALWGPGATAPKLAVAEELVACAGAARLREAEAGGQCWRFVDLLEAGDLAGALAALDAYAALAAELHQPFFAWRAAVHRAMLALLQGRFDQAERLGQDALAIGEQLGSRTPMLIAGIHHYVLRREQGRFAEIEPMLRGMAEQNASMPAFRAALAHFCAEAGRIDEARIELEAVARAGLASFPRDANWLSMMGELVQVVAVLGDAARAAELYDLLAPFAEQVVVTGVGDLCEGSVARQLGVLSATVGRFDVAHRHFVRGFEIDERIGARPYLARGKYELARMLVARAAPGDAVEAVRALDEGTTLAEVIGMAGLAGAITTLRAAIAAGAGAGNVMRGDARSWTVTFAGRSARLKRSRGLDYLALLVAEPGREWHALDLTAAVRGGAADVRRPSARELADERLAVRGLGDAGGTLDARGKAEYRARRDALRADVADAEAAGDAMNAARARAELEALERALAAAYGLGGRGVRAVSVAERARVAATKAIRQAIAACRREHPALGAHLDAAVRTGRFFAYRAPDGTAWQVTRETSVAGRNPTAARGPRRARAGAPAAPGREAPRPS